MSLLFKSLFCCTSSAADVLRDEAEEEATNHNEIDEIIYRAKLANNSFSAIENKSLLQNIINEEFLTSYEKESLKPFTKQSIIQYITTMEKLVNDNSILNTPTIEVYINILGSPLFQDVYFGKTVYKFNKEELYKNQTHHIITNDLLASLLISPTERMSWDKGVHSIEKIMTIETYGEDNDVNASLLHIVYNSPVIGVAKRDIVDKLIMFKDDNGVLYGYQSSIDESLANSLIENKDNITRGTTYINTFKIWEDEKDFHMISLYQTDMKIKLPESFLSMSLPFAVKKFYNSYYEKLKTYTKEKNK